jgi:hypothetical protein
MDIRLGKKKAGAYLNDYDDESHWAVGLFDCLDTHLDACTICFRMGTKYALFYFICDCIFYLFFKIILF